MISFCYSNKFTSNPSRLFQSLSILVVLLLVIIPYKIQIKGIIQLILVDLCNF